MATAIYYITTDVDSWSGNVGDRIPAFIAPDNSTNRTLGGVIICIYEE